jgi:hypothetical protein
MQGERNWVQQTERGQSEPLRKKERWGPDGSMGTLVPEKNNDLRTGGMKE